MVVTIAMTMASRGRSTKIAESIALALSLPHRLRHRACAHCRSWPYRLQPVHDHLIACRETRIDHDVCPAFAAGLHAPHSRLAVLNHEHIDAPLVGDQRSLRNDDLFIGLAALDIDLHQLAVDQVTVGIGYRGTDSHRVGGAV